MTTSFLWFMRHEIRLAWRDVLARLASGVRTSLRWVPLAILVFEVFAHGVAYAILAPLANSLLHPDKMVLLVATGSLFLTWMLFLSQGMETTTRSFYARADLDLLLSSPAPVRQVFAIRIGAIAASTVAMATLIAAPAVNVMALIGGARFLFAYGVLVGMGATAAAVAVCSTALLFRIFGAKRTRLLAQIIAAVVGAGCVIGVQAIAIMDHGTLSRLAVFQSPEWVAAAPDADSPLWWPVRAASGDSGALVAVLACALALLATTMVGTAGAFAANAQTVAGLPPAKASAVGGKAPMRVRAQAPSLRRKERLLLQRDPWLVSQSLMQILYLLPPALMLWYSYGSEGGSLVVLVPILVMAAGQLAGGLAWLAISGEDAPDLIATAPLTSAAIFRAKIEVVALAVALPLAPLVMALAVASPFAAGMTVVGAALAAAGASAVQYVFRVKGSRSNFRRRQTASRFATISEALVSISVAAAAGLAAAGLWLAVIPMGIATGILLASRAIASPRRLREGDISASFGDRK